MTGEDVKTLVKSHKLLTISIVICVLAGVWLYFRSDDLPALNEDLAAKDEMVQRYQANIDYS